MFSVMDIDPINSLKITFRWIRKDNFCSQFGLEMHLQVLLCLAITTLKCVAGIGTYMHVFDVKKNYCLTLIIDNNFMLHTVTSITGLLAVHKQAPKSGELRS